MSSFVHGMLGVLLPEVDATRCGCLAAVVGRFLAVRGRFPAVLREEVDVLAVAVADVLTLAGDCLAGDTRLLTPIAGELIIPLIAATNMSGEEAPVDVPTPATNWNPTNTI